MGEDAMAALSALPGGYTEQDARQALSKVYQKHVQIGTLTQDQANQLNAGPVDSVAQHQADLAKIAEIDKQLNQQAERNAKAAETLKNTAQAASFGATQ